MSDRPSLLSRRPVQFGLAGLVLLIAVGVGGWFFFFNDDNPDEVSLDAAVATLDDGNGSDTSGGSVAVEGIEGIWNVDTSIGEFDFQSATGSFVGFRIDEELGRGIGQTEAVGRTGTVSGSLTIEGTTLTATEVSANLDDLTTDRSGRDGATRRALDTGTFPEATFVLTEPVELGDVAADGEPVAAQAVGELTVRDVTLPATFDLEAQLVDGVVVVVGSTNVVFADYGVSVPSAGIVVSVADNGTVEFQLLFTR